MCHTLYGFYHTPTCVCGSSGRPLPVYLTRALHRIPAARETEQTSRVHVWGDGAVLSCRAREHGMGVPNRSVGILEDSLRGPHSRILRNSYPASAPARAVGSVEAAWLPHNTRPTWLPPKPACR
eukprot:5996215-Prymnesium_polylepis.1